MAPARVVRVILFRHQPCSGAWTVTEPGGATQGTIMVPVLRRGMQ
jgi:hypothetical protein